MADEPVDWEQAMMHHAPVAEPSFAEQPVVAEEHAGEEFRAVAPSPFVAEPGSSEEAEEEPWFVADFREPKPEPKPEVERPAQTDTWSGRPIGT